MSDTGTKAGDPQELTLETIADVLMTMSEVSLGDYSVRLEGQFDADNPVATLYEGINSMFASLESAHKMSSAYQSELEEKLATIEVQRLALRELSTPIIEVWEGVLCLPVVGVLDTTRSAEMTESLLNAIVEKKAECAIIDITGIQVMDTGTADHFLRMARAVQLLGASCMLTGINPAIAQTIIHMGVDLSGVVTHRTMRNALQQFLQQHADGVS